MPAASYIKRMSMADVFVYLDCVKYSKSDWENRNKILTPTGTIWLTVPVIQRSHEQKIFETFIDNNYFWAKKHLQSIRLAYAKTPCFREVFPEMEKIYTVGYERLIELNAALTGFFLNYLGLKKPEIVRSTDILKEDEMDGVKGQQLLVNICRAVGASAYLSGPNGRNYITPGFFESEKISVSYHDQKLVPYKQHNFDGEFQDYMAVIDLIMNYKPSDAADVIAGY